LTLGILGGAFNPPHIGHLVLAQEAAVRLSLDRVVLVPYGEAPHKAIERDPGPEVRLEMTRLAVDGDGRLAVSAIEVERAGPAYTYETLEALGREEPEAQLVLVMGADAATGLASWRRPERVLELASIGIAARAGTGEDEVRRVVSAIDGGGRVEVFEMPEVAVSSTLARDRVAAGEPIRYLVPAAVADYIERERLYSR
jgi:nicotinate-nucleotide adenylyltransferase